MSIFTHTLHTLHTLERERDPLRITKAQRLHSLLAQDLRFADLPNFKEKLAALSPVPLKDTTLSIDNNKAKKFSPRSAMVATVLSRFRSNDFSDPAKRVNYRVLRRLQLQGLEGNPTRGGQKNVSPVGGDTRRYSPAGAFAPRTIHGTIATLRLGSGLLPRFHLPTQVIPCIRRKVRREVMFARKSAGRGYRVKHRRTWSSGVPC